MISHVHPSADIWRNLGSKKQANRKGFKQGTTEPWWMGARSIVCFLSCDELIELPDPGILSDGRNGLHGGARTVVQRGTHFTTGTPVGECTLPGKQRDHII